VVLFPEITTRGIRIILTHQPGASSGMTELEAWGSSDKPMSFPTVAARNIAFDRRDGSPYPEVSASYTATRDQLEHLNDMQIAFTRYSRNRWSAYQSPNPSDWVSIDFGEIKTIAMVDLYLYQDGRGLAAPRAYAIQFWDSGQWVDATVRGRHPASPTASALNRILVDPVETERIRVVFRHDPPTFTGVTELMVWEEQW
jgi:hypothetical protein